MFSTVSSASGLLSDYEPGGLELLASVALGKRQTAYLSTNDVVDGSGAESTAISDFDVRLTNVSEAVLVSAKDKPGEAGKTSKTTGTGDVNTDENTEFTTTGLSGLRDNKDTNKVGTEIVEEKLSLVRYRETRRTIYTLEHEHGGILLKTPKSLLGLACENNKKNMKYSCDKCEKEFKFPSFLKRHMLCHDREIKFVCSECPDKSFAREYDLRRHRMVKHKKDCLYHCDDCSKVFARPTTLSRHRLKAHGKIKMVKCLQCDQSFRNKMVLCHHMLADHGFMKKTRRNLKKGSLIKKQNTDDGLVANHSFSVVEQPSTSGTQIDKSNPGKRHSTPSDNDMKLMYCFECHKQFYNYYTLKQHNIDEHNMQADYTCEYCSRGFSIITNMRVHKVKVHPDKVEGRNNCSYCGTKFWWLSELNTHVAQKHPEYVNTDKHKCFYCHESFVNRKKLKRHMLRSHKDKNVSENRCVYCNKQFIHQEYLKKHIKERHPDQ